MVAGRRLKGGKLLLPGCLSEYKRRAYLNSASIRGNVRFNGRREITASKLLLFGLPSFDDRHGQQVFVHLAIQFQNRENLRKKIEFHILKTQSNHDESKIHPTRIRTGNTYLFLSVLLNRIGGMSFLPQEFACTQEWSWMLEFPPLETIGFETRIQNVDS